MTDDVQRRLTALEQKVGTEQAMRVALLTDITARLDMLEHKAGEVPPADPAAEVPLTRDEAEEIATTCARIAAARPQAPSDLATVNMRGWRPHAWVVDAVLDGACRSRVGQARTEGALAELRSDHERDQQAIALRIAKVIGVYRDDDDDEFDLDTLLGMLEAKVTQLRQDACGACDAQRAAMEERNLLRDQRNAMRAERDQALTRVRELEGRIAELESPSAQSELDSLREQVTQLERNRATACGGELDELKHYRRITSKLEEQVAQLTVERDQARSARDAVELQLASMTGDRDGLLAAQVIRETQLREELTLARERHDQLFNAAQQRDRETSDLAAANTRLRADVASMSGDIAAVLTATGTRTISEATEAIAKLKAESIADVMAKLEQLRGQVANLTASSQWYGRWCELQDSLADALGMARQMWTEPHLIDQVRALKARASGGVANE